MLLTELTLTNFRCYEQVKFDELDRLVIFIGENDVGKTVLLDAVEVLLGSKACSPRDFRRLTRDSQANELILSGVFTLETQDTLPSEFRSGEQRDRLNLTRKFTSNGSTVSSEVSVLGQGFEDARFDNFVGAENQKSLLKEYSVPPASNDNARKAQRDQLISSGILRTVERLVTVPLTHVAGLNQHLPRVERISSVDYKTPDNIILRTLQRVANSVIMPVDHTTGKQTELPALQHVREEIARKLNEELAHVVPILQSHHVKLREVYAEPHIDFSRAVSTSNVILDCGDGEQGFDSFGEGTKKRIWMGLLDWERQANAGVQDRSVIRLYDEPDVNLHYDAQRQLFGNIQALASDVSARTQCLVCTHSVTLIDRAPSTSVNLIRATDDNRRTLSRIRSSGDEELIEFLTDIGKAVGLSNTVLLYERGFLIVEGESEETAIPIIYRNIFGRSMREDSLVLINLHSCSAWKAAIELFLMNRLNMIHILLDADCLLPDSSGRITEQALIDLGCSDDFRRQQVTYIGTKEFEDAFSSDLIASALNTEFPDVMHDYWQSSLIDGLKGEAKFSASLARSIRTSTVHSRRQDAKKPGIARAIANQCLRRTDVPPALMDALDRLRQRAGL